MSNELKLYIKKIREIIADPRDGLPEELFYFASCITAMTNVDLLIKNKKKQTLLTWRDDKYYGPGWHIPGGIIRFKETFISRINKVAQSELGMSVSHSKEPIAIRELFAKNRDVRGHFITFLYKCNPVNEPDIKKKCTGEKPKPGQWRWHDKCPKNLISQHLAYKKFINGHD
jgi:colanic acid biosynthesis protein WcaH